METMTMDIVRPLRILYMEDDPLTARMVGSILTKAGHKVEFAHDGSEGIQKFTSEEFDVLAIDQNMPVYLGIDVIKFLAELGPLPPSVMISGVGDEDVVIEAMKLGVSEYLVKDMDGRYLQMLPAIIEKAFQTGALNVQQSNLRRELLDKDKRLNMLQEHMLDLVGELDDRLVIDYISGSCAAFLGYNREDMINKSLLFFVPERDKQRLLTVIQNLSTNGHSTDHVQHRLRHRSGGYVDVESRYSIIQNGLSRKRFVLSAVNITGQKVVEHTLEERESELDAILKSTPAAVWSVDSDFNVTTTNYASKAMFANLFRSTLISGYPVRELLPQSIREEWTLRLERALDGERFKENDTFTIYLEDVAMQAHYVSEFVPVHHPESGVIGVLVHSQEVTDRILSEESLMRHAMELQQLNCRLERMTEVLGSGIKSHLQEILQTGEQLSTILSLYNVEHASPLMRTLLSSVTQLTALVDEATLLSELGRITMSADLLNMDHLMKQVFEKTRLITGANDVTFAVEERLPNAYGSEKWIAEVWYTLIANAIIHGGGKAGLVIEIGGEILEDGYAHFWVRDSGEGIAPEVKMRIFQEVDPIECVRTQGKGLGLAVVRQIVHKHGGTFAISGEFGEGTTVKFTLPVVNPAAPDEMRVSRGTMLIQ